MSFQKTAKILTLAAILAAPIALPKLHWNNIMYNFRPSTANSISEFNDDVILVACANTGEYSYVIQSLKDKNNLRSKKFKLQFTKKNNYLKISVPNLENGSIKTSYMHVVNKPHLESVLNEMSRKNITYDIVQMRGHTDHMRELYELTKNCASSHAIYFFGGCNSRRIAKEYETPDRVMIGGSGKQETYRNTSYLLKLTDLIGTDKATSWAKLHKAVKTSDRSFNHYFPK